MTVTDRRPPGNQATAPPPHPRVAGQPPAEAHRRSGAAAKPAATPGEPAAAGAIGLHQRPRSSWILAAVLAAASSAVTVLFLLTLARAIARHHWAVALDSSRDAVPALVGWAALAIALFAAGPADEPARIADPDEVAARAQEVASQEDSVRQATERVDTLSARLAALTAGLGTAGPGTGDQQSRQVAETAARLEQARQWRASAEDALARRRIELASAESAQQLHGPRANHLRKPDSRVRLVSL